MFAEIIKHCKEHGCYINGPMLGENTEDQKAVDAFLQQFSSAIKNKYPDFSKAIELKIKSRFNLVVGFTKEGIHFSHTAWKGGGFVIHETTIESFQSLNIDGIYYEQLLAMAKNQLLNRGEESPIDCSDEQCQAIYSGIKNAFSPLCNSPL